MDISEEAIAANRAYVYINKEVERVSKQAVEELNSKDIILIFPSQKKNKLNWNPSFQFASLSSDLANRLHK